MGRKKRLYDDFNGPPATFRGVVNWYKKRDGTVFGGKIHLSEKEAAHAKAMLDGQEDIKYVNTTPVEVPDIGK